MSYALPPRENRKRTSRRRRLQGGVAMHDSFPCEEKLVDSDKAGSPIVRRSSNDRNSNANPLDDADVVNETFSMKNNRQLATTRDDGNNKCKALDARQLDTASSGRSIEQYDSHNHKKVILSSIVGVAIIGASMIEGGDIRQVVFLVVCILAIMITHNALNKLIIQHNEESSRRLLLASSPSDNRGLQSGWGGLQSKPRITFELGVRNNNAPASSSSHRHWRQVKTMTNNIKSDDSPLVAKEESSSIIRSKEITQLLKERKKSSSSILFASDSITIKPPMQTLTRLEKRNGTMGDNEH